MIFKPKADAEIAAVDPREGLANLGHQRLVHLRHLIRRGLVSGVAEIAKNAKLADYIVHPAIGKAHEFLGRAFRRLSWLTLTYRCFPGLHDFFLCFEG